MDVVLKSGKSDSLLWVDEKCATHYWDKALNSYSCELTCQKNSNHLGWFAEEANSFYGTTHYMFAWVRALEPELIHISSLELCMVAKHDLQAYFRMTAGFSAGTPTGEIVTSLFSTERIAHVGALKIKQCNICPEFPVNVIFPKDLLVQMSTWHRVYSRFDVRDALRMAKNI